MALYLVIIASWRYSGSMHYLSFRDIPILDLPDGLKVKNLVRHGPRTKKFRDHTGEEYGFIEVIGFVGYVGIRTMWLCVCHHCEQKRVIGSHNLKVIPLNDVGECPCPKSRDYHHWQYLRRRYEVEGWESFSEYLADVGKLLRGYRVEPANPDKPLGPSNFRRTDLPGRRSGEILVSKYGAKGTAKEWAAKLGITYRALQYRFAECDKLGIPRSRALTKEW